MDNTLWNIIAFLLSTLVYFLFLKPKVSTSSLEDLSSYASSSHITISIYFIGVVLLQFFINTASVISTCGGSTTSNIGAAALLTFVPWFFIFGMVIVALIVFPGFKSAFSDVIGYFWVANKANAILSDLLVDNSVSSALNSEETPSQTPAARQSLEDVASVIVKITGNISIIINQIVPENFESYWKILTPLMKTKYQQDPTSSEILQKKQELLDVVVARDNVGEAFWYIYTGILLISIVQFNIVSRGCTKDVGTMKANLDNYLTKQASQDKKNKAASVSYVNTTTATSKK